MNEFGKGSLSDQQIEGIIELAKTLKNNTLNDDYLVCLKGDIALFAKGSAGVCLSLTTFKRRFIKASGGGLSVQLAGGVALVVYSENENVDKQVYEEGFSIGGPELISSISKYAIKIFNTKVGVGFDVLWSSSPTFGSFFLIGVQVGGGVDLSELDVTVSKH